MSINLEHIAEKYGDVSIKELEHSDDFVRDITQDGTNQSRFLVRRFSFRKPRLSIRTNPSLVYVDMLYGFNNRQTLFTFERTILTPPEYSAIYVKDIDQPLSSIEEEVGHLLGMRKFKFDRKIRETKLASYLTTDSPYSFKIKISVDTLSTYGEVDLHVVLDYMDINDAANELAKISDEMKAETKSFFRLPCGSQLAYKYREHVNSNPHIRTASVRLEDPPKVS